MGNAPNINGLWVVEYEGVEGGAGIVVLVNGRLMGGNYAYTYDGHYAVHNGFFAASIHVANFVPGIPNSLGYIGDYSAELTAPVLDTVVQGTLSVVGQPGRSIHVKLTKKADL